jgi:hypothetical protein
VEEAVYQRLRYGPDFSTTFVIDPPALARRLRWDPVELRLCTLRLRRVLWRDVEGTPRELDLGLLTSNGERLSAGYFRFATVDPMVFLPVAGTVADVTLEGECVVDDEAASLRGLEALLARRDGELQCLRQLLEERERHFRERERQLLDLRGVCAELSALLQALQNSRRGRLSNWLRTALHYLPKHSVQNDAVPGRKSSNNSAA